MKFEEYIERLRAGLKGLDPDEAESAVQYYTELIEEAEDPEEQMASLGSPEDLAQRIKEQNGVRPPVKQSGGSIAARVMALVLTSPLWITVFILLGSAMVVVGAVFVAFPAASLGEVFDSFRLFGTYGALGVIALGLVFLFAGLTILLLRPVRLAFRGIASAMAAFARFLFTGRKGAPSEALGPVNRTLLIAGIGLTGLGILVSGATAAVARPTKAKYIERLGLVTETCDLGQVESLKAEIRQGDVRILPSQDGKATLEAVNIDSQYLTLVQGPAVDVKYDNKDSGSVQGVLSSIFGADTDTRLTIYLPQQEYQSILLDLDLGDAEITGFTVDELTLDLDCGNAKLINFTASNADVDLDLGDLTLSSGRIDRLHTDLNTGSMEVSGSDLGTVTADMDLGSAEFESVSAQSLDMDLDCGDLEYRGTLTGPGETKIELELGDVILELEGTDYRVYADTDLGDTSINGQNSAMAASDGSVVIRAHASCGDVTVNYR